MIDPLGGPEYRLRLHHHASAAAVWVIVGGVVLVGGVVAYVVEADLDVAGLGGALEDARAQDAREHLREERQDVEQQSSVVLVEQWIERFWILDFGFWIFRTRITVTTSAVLAL